MSKEYKQTIEDCQQSPINMAKLISLRRKADKQRLESIKNAKAQLTEIYEIYKLEYAYHMKYATKDNVHSDTLPSVANNTRQIANALQSLEKLIE